MESDKELVFSARFAEGAATLHPVGGRVRIPALLFVAGEYPDKGVTITEDDLDALIGRFNAARTALPVKAEHFDSPLDPLGEIVALHREGANLFGMLAFSEGVARHIAERGAQNLSVALFREPDGQGFSLQEVSLVFRARVPGASLLSPSQAQEKLAQFRLLGKITPAMEGPLMRLLSVPSVLTFADGATLNVAAETEALLKAFPILAPRGGQIPAAGAAQRSPFVSAPVPSPYAAATTAPAELTNICARLGVAAEKAMAHWKE